MRVHVAIVLPRFARLILAGDKRAEARLGRDRRAPFGVVSPEDMVYFKVRSGGYACRAVVARVESRELASPADVRALRSMCDADVRGTPEYWRDKARSRYATIAWFERVEAVEAGPDLSRFVTRGCRSAWHVVPEEIARSIVTAAA